MRRPLYIDELAAQPFPLGLVGHMLVPFERLLQTVCFADNETGDKAMAPTTFDRKIVVPCNRLLHRNGKPLRLSAIRVEPSRHHTVCVTYQVQNGSLWVDECAHVSLFLASKKAIAMERKADEAGDTYTVVAPRRGEAPAKKKSAGRKRHKSQSKKTAGL